MSATPAKAYSAPALYKDYNKATKDLLTKHYQQAGSWKIESKYKGPKDTFFVNPTASSDGSISADIEYNPSSCNGSIKMNISPKGLDNFKTTASYNVSGHKFEAIIQTKEGECFDYEVSHETAVMAGKRMSMNEKLTKRAITLGLGIDVAPNCQVGCGADYMLKEKQCNWGVGCRYAHNGIEAAIRTQAMKTYITSASVPLRKTVNGNQLTLNLAAETICGKGRGVDATFGFEATCPVLPANTLKARVNRNMEWAVAYLAKVADNWMIAVTVDHNLKAGFLFSHS